MLVDALTETPESGVVGEKDNRKASLKRLNKHEVSHRPEKYQLGNLWTTGELGGEPLVKIKIHVEGGGDGRDLRTRCRNGSSCFFERANLAGRMPRVIAYGGKDSAIGRFRTAIGARKAGEFIVLLADSEHPVADGGGPWKHLAGVYGWHRPVEAVDEHAHLMVRRMEAWFLSDTEGLAKYVGRDFRRNALPGQREIKETARVGVLEGLRKATQGCTRGEYTNGRHSFEILEQFDPATVLDASPHARRLIDTLREKAT